MDAAYIYGPDAVRLPATRAPYVAWTGQPRPRDEDCGDDRCVRSRQDAWQRADAEYDRAEAARRYANDMEFENATLRRQLGQLTRAIEGAA